jgi:hypothetical protein
MKDDDSMKDNKNELFNVRFLGFLFCKLLRSGENGIVASSYVELFSSENLLEKYSSLSEKVDLLRSERDAAQSSFDYTRFFGGKKSKFEF